MTGKDLTLIGQAKKLDCTDWYLCNKLASEAESDEAKEWINDHGKRLYHKEEAFADLL